MTRVVISQPMYLPWAGFLAHLSLADVLIWLDDAQFSKGSFTNRVQIPKGDGVGWLSIPLVKSAGPQLICDLKPAQEDWLDRHRSSLRNCYSKSQGYEDVTAVLDASGRAETLAGAIVAGAEHLMSAVGVPLPKTILHSSQMDVQGTGSKRVLDLVKSVQGTTYITGLGARHYLEHMAFDVSGVSVEYMDYDVRPWPQETQEFTPYISSLDLVAHVWLRR